jgi:prevent-host-death family protein
MQINSAQAKARLSELVRRAEAGEEIEVTRYGRVVARIVALPPLQAAESVDDQGQATGTGNTMA